MNNASFLPSTARSRSDHCHCSMPSAASFLESTGVGRLWASSAMETGNTFQRTRLKVLPVSIALDSHSRPTPVLSKKLAALGMEQWQWSDLERAVDGKNEALFIHRTQAGATLT